MADDGLTYPQLSMYLPVFSTEPTYDWPTTLALARAMDVAGIERVAVSDHVVFGENADAYGDPRVGGIQPTGPTAHGSNRSPCSRRSPHRRPGFDSTRHRQHGRHTQARTIRHRLDPLGIGVG